MRSLVGYLYIVIGDLINTHVFVLKYRKKTLLYLYWPNLLDELLLRDRQFCNLSVT
jgi:hypothetical protein